MVVCSSGASSPWRPELPKERKSLDRSRISNCSWIEQIYKYFRSVHTSLNFRHIFYILRDQLRLKQYLEIRHARESTDASKEIPSTSPPSVMDKQRSFGSKGALLLRTKDFGICERTDKEPCANHREFEHSE